MAIYLEIAGAVLIIFIAALLILIASRPAAFKIERTADMSAPPAAVFALINDFHQWTKWSPWEKLDPNLERTYGGSPTGAGATYAWVGNKKAGEGHMSILESTPDSLLHIQLEFLKPMVATNQTYFRLSPTQSGTKVVWSMEGTNNFMGKAFCMFVNMDKLVGTDFEKGLAAMNAAAHAGKR